MRFSRIVVGMDFSDTAISSARWVSEHFAPNAELILVHVIDPPDRPRFSLGLLPTVEVVETAARAYALERTKELAPLFGSRAPRCEIRVGKPYQEMTKVATQVGADLLVVGPHGDRPRPSTFLGTTAERIVRTSPVPVLVATNPPSGRPRKLLVAVDDASITPTLLETTRDLAEAFDADVDLLHVWSNAVYSHVASMSYVTTRTDTEAEQEIKKELREASEHWLAELARTGIKGVRVTASVTNGKPGEAIIERASTVHADLIALGRRGSGLVAPALLGSTVGTVLHRANCPILVVTGAGEASSER